MREGDHVLVTSDAKSIKVVNAERDARVAFSIVARDDPYEQLLVRGTVVEQRPDPDLSVLDAFSQKYLGWPVPAAEVVGAGRARHRARPRAVLPLEARRPGKPR